MNIGELLQDGYTLLDARELRDYQDKILVDVKNAIKDMLRMQRHKAIPGEKPLFPKLSSMLIESATGTGKTFTTGTLINQLWHYKNSINHNHGKNIFPDFNILVLNDRIGLVEQLREEFVDGKVTTQEKTIQAPIFDKDLLSNLSNFTYHSEVDDRDEDANINLEEEVVVDGHGAKDAKETIHFSTLQTARLSATKKSIGAPNIIIIDEADIITMKTKTNYNTFMETLMSYYIPDKNGYYPLVIPITATPDTITKDIFGDPRARFGLGEYLAHPRSPHVIMSFETPPGVDKEKLQEIYKRIQEISKIEDYKTKKEALKLVKEEITVLLPPRETDEQKRQFLDRAIKNIIEKIGPDEKSLIFNSFISESDYTAEQINALVGKNIAVARHSNSKEDIATTLQGLKDGTKPIVTSVGQLIRGIDVPSLDNVFSLINTSNAKKYLQLFGRGMRGEIVKFYDYGGSFENMAWLGNIYKEYKEAKEKSDREGGKGGGGGDNLEIIIDGNPYDGGDSHEIPLFEIIIDVKNLEDSLQELPRIEEIRRLFMGGASGEEHLSIDHYKDMTARERQELFTDGFLGSYNLGSISLAKLFGIQGDCVNKKEIRHQVLEQIFATSIESVSIEGVRRLFMGGASGEEHLSIDHYKDMTQKERQELFTDGFLGSYNLGSKSLAKLFGIQGNVVHHKDVRHQVLEQIFKTSIERIGIEEVRRLFMGGASGEEHLSIDHYKDMTARERQRLFTDGFLGSYNLGSKSLAKLFGVQGDCVGYKEIRHQVLEQIFETSIERVGIEEVRRLFMGGASGEEHLSIDHYKDMTLKERQELFTDGFLGSYNLGSTSLAKLFGIQGDCVNKKEIRHQVLEQIFETNIESVSIEGVRRLFMGGASGEEHLSIDHYKDMTARERQELFTDGFLGSYNLGSTSLAKLFGIQGSVVHHKDVRHQVLEQIFATSIERVSIEEIRRLFMGGASGEEHLSIDHYKDMTARERQRLFTDGFLGSYNLGSKSLAKLFGIQGNVVHHKDVRHQVLKKIFEVEYQDK